MIAMNWAMQRQMACAAPSEDSPSPAVWLVGHGFGGAVAITTAQLLASAAAASGDGESGLRVGALLLMATALAGPTTCAGTPQPTLG